MSVVGIVPFLFQMLFGLPMTPHQAYIEPAEVTPYEEYYTAEGNRIYDREHLLTAADSTAINDFLLREERHSSLRMVFLSSATLHGYDHMFTYGGYFTDSLTNTDGNENLAIVIAISAAQGSNGINRSRNVPSYSLDNETCNLMLDEHIIPLCASEEYAKAAYLGFDLISEKLRYYY